MLSRNNQQLLVTSDIRNRQMIQTGGKKLSCEICNKCFSQSGSLEIHMMVHTQENPFNCEQCGKHLSTIKEFKRHQRKHTGEKPYLCNQCEKKFSQIGHLRRHERIHSGDKRFICAQCDKSYTQGVGLKIHLRFHTGEKPYTCSQCGKSFMQLFNLQRHENKHPDLPTEPDLQKKSVQEVDLKYEGQASDEKVFKNEKCKFAPISSTPPPPPLPSLKLAHSPQQPGQLLNIGRKESQYQFLQNNFEQCFIKERFVVPTQKKKIQLAALGIFPCSGGLTLDETTQKKTISFETEKIEYEQLEDMKREKHFTSEFNLNDHIRRHDRERPIGCNKSFTTYDPLKIHRQGVHRDKLSFICNKCEKSFSSKGDFRKHEQIHNRQRHLVCSECGKKFFTQTHLNRHQMIHTGEKPYVCGKCGKSFSQNVSLLNHKLTHTGERPHLCIECGKSFAVYGNFKVHQMSHGEKPFKCSKCGKQFIRADAFKKHKGSNSCKE